MKYHSSCLAKHVRNVLRSKPVKCRKLGSAESELVAEIEFIKEVEKGLQNAEIQTLNHLVVNFKVIRENNGQAKPDIY